MTPLPIDHELPRILNALDERGTLVLVAPPGSGKTTRVPAAMVRRGGEGTGAVLVLQPRRVAARSTAARIALEQGWTLGREVGYHVRFERRASADSRLVVMTEGILARRLLADPFLEGVAAVVLDEFHERSLHSDLALALLREVRREVRPDLRVVVMSATLDAGPVAAFLDAPVIEAPGRAFPVAISYRDVLRPTDPEAVAGAVAELLADPADRGHVLAFLPGAGEIRRAQSALGPVAAAAGAVVLPLHGSLPSEEQDAALRPSNQRKIILATNIAETSLTIDGVTAVVDSGQARVAGHDASRGLDRLDLKPISRASADQRAGRAGRAAPGRCVRLWSEQNHALREPFETPEVRRVDLGPTLLTLHSWGVVDPRGFAWYEPPELDRIDAAEALLARLGAFDPTARRITPTGERMLALPVHPRMARLLLAAADSGLLREGAALAALLSEKDIAARRPSSGRRGASDLLDRLDLLAEAEASRFSPALAARGIDPAAARQAARIRDDLVRLGSRLEPAESADLPDDDREEALSKLLVLAYPDRVVRRRGAEETGVMVGGRGVRLTRESVVREGEFFLALDPREQRGRGTLELLVSIASAVRLEWLEEAVPRSIRRERRVEYDTARERVAAMNRIWYEDILIREDPAKAPDGLETSRALFEALRPRAGAIFRGDPAAASWLARYEFVREAVPELGWPALDDDALSGPLEVLCHGKAGMDEVRRASKVVYLEGLLSREQSRDLDACAPAAITIPSGRSVRLEYEPGRQPVLAVKIQELFGWSDAPRLARGRVPLLLELLAPNHRPAQVTSDLRGFWADTYQRVRKDLRGRYPKHPWPDDPATAQAPSRGPRPR